MPKPPVAKKDPREFEIHGRKMMDDYFWLRNKESEEVINYLEEENAYTDKMMAHTEDLQKQLFREMKERIKETDESVPIKIGGFFYYFRTEKGKDYKIHCRKKGTLDAPEEVILDENLLAETKEYMRKYRKAHKKSIRASQDRYRQQFKRPTKPTLEELQYLDKSCEL